jgi:hypothetical protein
MNCGRWNPRRPRVPEAASDLTARVRTDARASRTRSPMARRAFHERHRGRKAEAIATGSLGNAAAASAGRIRRNSSRPPRDPEATMEGARRGNRTWAQPRSSPVPNTGTGATRRIEGSCNSWPFTGSLLRLKTPQPAQGDPPHRGSPPPRRPLACGAPASGRAPGPRADLAVNSRGVPSDSHCESIHPWHPRGRPPRPPRRTPPRAAIPKDTSCSIASPTAPRRS